MNCGLVIRHDNVTLDILLSHFFHFKKKILGGWLSLKIGGKLTASLTIFLGSIFTLMVSFQNKIYKNMKLIKIY